MGQAGREPGQVDDASGFCDDATGPPVPGENRPQGQVPHSAAVRHHGGAVHQHRTARLPGAPCSLWHLTLSEATAAMADTAAQNGERHRKRREALPGGASAAKKIRLEDPTPPEANPNTIEAVREKNRALEIDMKEKNRRIAYLAHKCEALYRSRGVTGASFRCLRRQWFQLQDELLAALKAVDPSSAVADEASTEAWQAALAAVDGFGQVRVRAEELRLNLPEWFITVAKDADEEEPDADVALPSDDDADDKALIREEDLTRMEQDVHGELTRRSDKTKELLQKLLAAVGAVAADKAKTIEYAQILQEKRAAVAETLILKGRLQSQRGSVNTDGADVDDVKTEQGAHSKNSGEKASSESSDTVTVKQEEIVKKEKEHAKIVGSLQETMSALSSKLHQERQKIESMRRELEKFKALEVAVSHTTLSLPEVMTTELFDLLFCVCDNFLVEKR
ncbi:unnamed protein product [Phytophthora fragariaefolia]|uniref:E3 ubiquitin protein ligase n=1 Tax=Phytophthora fragariaefolia TaxID=1490495 RepID=A0A9W6U524_9STRA|nr:unnamed protein product [Phytophthora fragariaefolia]